MQAHPFKFSPIYKERIWGGQKLRKVFGKNIPPGEKIGESWEIADLPQDKSVITNGELAGQTLAEAVQKYPKEITGDKNFPLPYPLLIKFIDAEDILSVQVHPDRQTCKRLGKGDPKTECWYVISAKPGAFIYKGLKKSATKQQFANAIEEGTTPNLLTKINVEPGQCHFLPAGTVHSLGPGILVAEVQTPSDTTYRVFDWNRVDDTGKPRELHIPEALESIHFDFTADDLPATTTGRLADCEYFKIDKNSQAKSAEVPLSRGRMRILIFVSGRGTISSPNTAPVEFKAGNCILIPAAFEGILKSVVDTQYLIVTL